MHRLAFALSLLLLMASCRSVTAVKMMNDYEVKPERWTNGKREVVFLPMVHVSRPEFYLDAIDRLSDLKAKGYVVYFESVQRAPLTDSAQYDLVQRKMRKMLGFRLGQSSYADMLHERGLFRDRVNQPEPKVLGMSDRDRIVDVTAADVVTAYEQRYGPIVLEKIDSTTALTEKYNASARLPLKQVMAVIIESRNEHLAKYIHGSADTNVVVVYGYAHKKGTLEHLRTLDKNWRKK